MSNLLSLKGLLGSLEEVQSFKEHLVRALSMLFHYFFLENLTFAYFGLKICILFTLEQYTLTYKNILKLFPALVSPQLLAN